jgi:membrane-associated phospholipid phosphatase
MSELSATARGLRGGPSMVRRAGARSGVFLAIAASLWTLPATAEDPPDLAAAAPTSFTPDFLFHDIRLEPIAVAVAVLPTLSYLAPQSHAGGAPDAGHHAHRSGPSTASDVLLVSGMALTIAGGALSEAARDGRFQARHLRASMVIAEAILLGSSATQVPKRAIGRCRPSDWNDDVHTCDPSAGDDAFQSMWSGHTATLAAGAGAASCLALRDGTFGWTGLLAITSEVVAATTGVLRVAAGAHSWSDVAVGFGAGNLLGVAMCLAHPTTRPSSPISVQAAEGGVGLRVELR